MNDEGAAVSDSEPKLRRRLPRHVAILGVVSLLTAMSSAMIYGLLPVFMVKVLGASMTSVGFIEGMAEAMMSLTRIFSGIVSDRMGRRKPLLLFGYAISAVNKLMFPLAGTIAIVLAARVIDRIGKGLRDAPRDAFMGDVTPTHIRGSGFGLRLAFYTTGFVVGPLAAMAVMKMSGDDFHLVFWIAVIPSALAIGVLLFGIKENVAANRAYRPLRFRRADLTLFPKPYWSAVAIASLQSLARFSYAFLVLAAHGVGVDSAYVPIMLVLMHLVYAVAAYPFGILADHVDRRLQLAVGAVALIVADIVLATASVAWVVAIGAGLWGLQMAVTQGLLAASVADAASPELRGTAFGIYDLTIGLATFVASTAAGALWMIGGAPLTFGCSGLIAVAAVILLLFQKLPATGPL
jgi:MFS family permease